MKKGRNHTLFRMIMGRILIMLGVIVLLTCLLVMALGWSAERNDVWHRVDHFIADAQSSLAEGDYQKIAESRYLSEEDAFDVVDESGKLLYSSRGRKEDYTSEYLSYIPDYEENEGYALYDISSGGYLLIHDDKDGIASATILDQNRNVLYSTLEHTDAKLSEKSMELLQGSEDTLLQKYAFTDEKGQKGWLLIYLDISSLYDSRRAEIEETVILAVYIIGIILTVLIGGYTLAKKVTRPIHQLEEGMEQFSKGSREPLKEIRGPKEVAAAAATFNRMNAAIVQAEEEKQKLVEQKRRITADLSHDLKTPVTVVQGYADAMRDGLIKEEDYPKYLNIISDKTAVLADLINQISTYNKLDHPDVQLHFTTEDMSEFVRSYFASRYSEMEAADHEIMADIVEEKIMVQMDRTEMNRVLDNLVSNSLKHTPRGTRFFVVLRKEEDNAVLLTGDDGKGIDPQLAPHIFEPFIMGDASRTTGSGSGLGLSIVHSIIEKHHGTIALASQEDMKKIEDIMHEKIEHGTFFRIVIPSVSKEN